METIKTTLYIHKRIVPSERVWEDNIQVHRADMTSFAPWQGAFVLIGTHEVEVPIPDVDVTAKAIDALDEEAERIMQEARAKVAELHERIAKLRCLEHKAEGEK